MSPPLDSQSRIRLVEAALTASRATGSAPVLCEGCGGIITVEIVGNSSCVGCPAGCVNAHIALSPEGASAATAQAASQISAAK